MRTETRTKTVRYEVYIVSDGKEFETRSSCENHEKMLNGTRKKCCRCNGTGRINGRYKTVLDHLHFTEEEIYVYDECPECGGKGYLEKVTTTEWK